MFGRIAESVRTYWLWYTIVLVALAAFVVLPGGFAGKARTVLHGLCAQTPTHSFSFGGVLLPFDARMTGIYGGVLATLVFAAVQGRLLARGTPPRRLVAILGLGVIVMAVDGFNSLFLDLGLWHPYGPRNELRLITGYATGIALAAALVWLLGSSVFRAGRPEPVMRSFADLGWLWVTFMPYAALVLSGASWLYVPLSTLLMVSAWLTMSMLALVVVVLALRLDERIVDPARLHRPGAAAAIIGLVVMLLLATGRIWLEAALGIPSTL